MSRLSSKWLNSLLGDDTSLAVYLSSDAMIVRTQQQDTHQTQQHAIAGKGWAQAFSQAVQGLTDTSSVPLASIALASEYFDSYVLNFQEIPNNQAEQQTLIQWTLKKRKLIQDDDNIDARLRYQLMGKTANGYKVLVEILHSDAASQLNTLTQSGCIIADSVCRASHHVYNHLQHTGSHAPGALLYCEPDYLSGYYWNEDGVLSFYRDHTLSAHGVSSMGEFANDVTSIIRRLEASEWHKPLNTVFVASSSLAPTAGQPLIESLAGHLPEVEITGITINASDDPVLQVVGCSQA